MAAKTFIENTKVMAKGQVTIPKDVREALGVTNGDHVTFIVEGNVVCMANSSVFAMQALQKEMEGAGEDTGLSSDEDVMAAVKELRNKEM